MNKRILAKNKHAYAEYEVLDTYEAGIKLTGAEVKSAKLGHIKLDSGYALLSPENGVLELVGVHISAYKPASGMLDDYDPLCSRVLLLNKKQISALIGKLKQKHLTLAPLSVYSKSGIIKVELGLARGKKQYEKRESIKKRDIERDIGRKLKS